MYYIYGHFLDGKCIYIGSNCMNMNNSRAYDLSDGTIKMLLKSEKEFIPYYSRLQNAKGLKLKRLN